MSNKPPDLEQARQPVAPPAAPKAESGAPPPATMLQCRGWDGGYRLIDSGGGRKLERFGERTIARPEPLALWAPSLHAAVWEKADATFDAAADEDEGGRWRLREGGGENWIVPFEELSLQCRLTPFRHIGLFPEQAPHWLWMRDAIAARASRAPFRLLNLFGYTGAASLVAAAAGAEVTHLDASKQAIAWARENQSLSNLSEKPVRWICDDAMKFAARETRRGALYHGVLLDPPKFGRGPKNETWTLSDDLPSMLDLCGRLLHPDASFLILTAYAVRLSYFSLYELMRDVMGARGGEIDAGELVLRDDAGRFAPTSLFARWRAQP